MINGKVDEGQDIMATCLEGPPGSGKTEYAKTYVKLLKEFFGDNVELLSCACTPETSKNELYEDINVVAVVQNDAERVNIPGILTRAIVEVNKGKKVVLFLDEFDKANETIDNYLLDFLQSGSLNMVQQGELNIKDEYKANLQVILCKNMERVMLSDQLTRRLRIIRLDYMKPELLYQVINRKLVLERDEDDKVKQEYIDLVSLIYDEVYKNKDMFQRLPSCSEVLIALSEINMTSKYVKISLSELLNEVLELLFKDPNDYDAFVELAKMSEGKLNNLIKSLTSVNNENVSIESLIKDNYFKEQAKEIDDLKQELQSELDKYKEKLKNYRESSNNDESQKKKLYGVDFERMEHGNMIDNFSGQSSFIKRGMRVEQVSNDFYGIAYFESEVIKNGLFLNDFINECVKNKIMVLEDGFLINRDNYKLALVRQNGENKSLKFIFLSDSNVLSTDVILTIYDIMNNIFNIFSKNYKNICGDDIDNDLKGKITCLVTGEKYDLFLIKDENKKISLINFEGDFNKFGELVMSINDDVNISTKRKVRK